MYGSSLQHILAELERLDLLLRIQVCRARQGRGEAQELAAFYIPEAEPDEFLDKAIGAPVWAGVPIPPELRAAVQTRLDQLSVEISQHAAESLREGVPLRLAGLAGMFDLTAFDLDVILVCLAPELDRGYERLYAYLHDDVMRRRPTVDLLLNLLCPDLETKIGARARFAPPAPLLEHHLVQLREEPGHGSSSWLGHAVQLDPRVASFLLDGDAVDDRLRPCARLVSPAATMDALVFPEAFRRQLRQLTDRAQTVGQDGADPRLLLYLQGPRGVGRRAVAEACCRALDRLLLIVDGKRLAASAVEEFAMLAGLAAREARLQAAVIYWEDIDALLADEDDARLAALLSVLEAHPHTTFVSGSAPWEPGGALGDVTFVRLTFPSPAYSERLLLWRAASVRGRGPLPRLRTGPGGPGQQVPPQRRPDPRRCGHRSRSGLRP